MFWTSFGLYENSSDETFWILKNSFAQNTRLCDVRLAYIFTLFFRLYFRMSCLSDKRATLLSYLQNNIRVWIFLPAIIISHMGFGVYMLILFLIVILLLICRGLMDDEMLCIIASENLGIAFSC